MKKVKIETYFILDDSSNSREIQKLKFSVEVLDSETGEIITSTRKFDYELGAILKSILNRWDSNSNRMVVTATQWNNLKKYFLNQG